MSVGQALDLFTAIMAALVMGISIVEKDTMTAVLALACALAYLRLATQG